MAIKNGTKFSKERKNEILTSMKNIAKTNFKIKENPNEEIKQETSEKKN